MSQPVFVDRSPNNKGHLVNRYACPRCYTKKQFYGPISAHIRSAHDPTAESKCYKCGATGPRMHDWKLCPANPQHQLAWDGDNRVWNGMMGNECRLVDPDSADAPSTSHGSSSHVPPQAAQPEQFSASEENLRRALLGYLHQGPANSLAHSSIGRARNLSRRKEAIYRADSLI